MKSMNWIGVLALAIAFGICMPAGAAILMDDFDDDSGALTGETANTGQTWEDIVNRTSLDIGAQFGQSGNGAGNDNGGGAAWKANKIPLGEIVNDGTIIIAVDFKKQHIAGPINEINLALTSSTQGNKTTALIYAADWLKLGGSWTYGGGQLNVGIPVDLHVELILNLVDGGSNTVEFRYEEIGNPANNGSLVAPGSIDGTLNYDTFELWANTRNGRLTGFDNVSIVPEPATLTILGMAGLAMLSARRPRR